MNCDIEGVVVRELKRYDDDRGWLLELLRQDELDPQYYPVMSYVSMSLPGVARGPHEHKEQADLFGFIGPSTFRLYLWDNREASPSFGRKAVIEVGEDNPVLVIVPAGVVHGYRNVGTANGLVYNSPNRLYAGPGKKNPVDEVRYEDEPGSRFRLG
jgi:dTDP-4-dehydrorhamnose 3,5-epimerase